MQSEDIILDVTGAVPIEGRLDIAATVFSPDGLDPEQPPVVLFAFPGGGYGRGYFHLTGAGLAGYSEAEYHTARGWVVVALDHLGVGDSTVPDLETLEVGMITGASDAAVRAALDRLAAGTLTPTLPPLRPRFVLGEGQSMGGCLLVTMQGRFQTFDAVAILGFSSVHTVLPVPPEDSASAPARADAPPPTAEEVSALVQRVVSYAFHWPDVPAEIVNADLGGGFPVRTGPLPPWASATTPPAAAAMISPGVVANEAASIEVPVFVGFGERDVVVDPKAEPKAYPQARDITVLVVPEMAHMHNFAGTRRTLWERVHNWADDLAATR